MPDATTGNGARSSHDSHYRPNEIGTAPSEMATEYRANTSPGKSGRPDEGRGTNSSQRAEILDACCGGRMWWWDKTHPLAIFMDNRTEPKGSNPARANWHIQPDFLGDFRAMPFDDASFQLVVFDPPHIVRENPSGIYPLYYGALRPETEQADLRRGFAECWRVLAPGGTLVFKWAGSLERVEPHFPATPIIGNRLIRASSGLGTRWLIFYKPLRAELGAAVQEVLDLAV